MVSPALRLLASVGYVHASQERECGVRVCQLIFLTKNQGPSEKDEMKIQSNPWLLIKGGKEVKFRPPFETMAEMIEHWAKKQPEKTAIEFVDVDKSDKSHNDYKKYNWRELKEKVFAAAEMLKRRGLKRGDTIAFGYHNHPNILILSLAAWTGGIRTVPLDLKRDDEEMMKYKLELSGAKVFFREGEEGDKNGDKSYKSYKNYNNSGRISLDAEALVLFTSGTTAKPKGAVLTQANLMANADGISDWLEIKNSDKFMIVLPLHHINSTTMSLATLLRGGTIVLVSRYTNSQFFEIAARTGATLTSVVPTIIHDQLSRWRNLLVRRHPSLSLRASPSLRSGWPQTAAVSLANLPTSIANPLKLTRIQLGSAPVVAKEAEEFVRLTGIPLVQGYGQTETALRSTGARWSWKNLRSNTIGSEMKWTNVTIMRGMGGEGREGREGQEGEICVRGPVIMKKYLKNQEATGDAFKYGWFHSGDLGYWKMVDGKRQFFIKGRIKEIIIKAGVNVSPMAVEEKILKSVDGVDQVYVVGVGDERVGEEVGAVVVWKRPWMSLDGVFSTRSARNPRSLRRRRQDDSEIQDFSGSSSMVSKTPSSTHFVIKGLSNFERPKYWFSMAAEKLPMTSTGKVQRVKLREMFKECAAIAERDKYMFRVISAVEEEMIEAARQMYNQYWAPLAADKKTWEREMKEKILIGAFNKETGELAGWIRVKEEGRAVTADAVTAAGNKNYKSYKNYNRQTIIDKKDVEIYLGKKIDPVIEWHRRAKAGWKRGAEIVRVVANARPGDTPALGYGVLMEYPEFAKMPAPKVSAGVSLGTQLVEAGLVYAYRRGYNKVRVLSRPVGLWRWVFRNTRKTRKAGLSDNRRVGISES